MPHAQPQQGQLNQPMLHPEDHHHLGRLPGRRAVTMPSMTGGGSPTSESASSQSENDDDIDDDDDDCVDDDGQGEEGDDEGEDGDPGRIKINNRNAGECALHIRSADWPVILIEHFHWWARQPMALISLAISLNSEQLENQSM